MSISSVCVYCASNKDTPEPLRKVAREVGAFLGRSGVRLVYGGASIGMMGEVADACMDVGGLVTGVIPESLKEKEVAHPLLTELIVTTDMHERKMTMFELADAFVTLPGGLGTLEETLEIMTWKYLGYHDRPILLLNIDGYYDHLIAQFNHCRSEGLARKESFEVWQICSDTHELFEVILNP